jgi:hypothetical protein
MKIEGARVGTSRDLAWASIGAALLLCPALAAAQSSSGPHRNNLVISRSAPKPVCEYKAVMSDAEIEACTGRRVHYDYRIRECRQPPSR